MFFEFIGDRDGNFVGYEEALNEAQKLGYAEADPTLDVNGWDAAHKAILLATLSYGFIIDPEKVYVRGIERVRGADKKKITIFFRLAATTVFDDSRNWQ